MERPHEISVTNRMESPFVAVPSDDVARLLGIRGPLAGASYELIGDDVSVGRRPDNAVCIPSPNVSKLHCRIVQERLGRRVIVDAGSTNGTIVNGRRLEPGRPLQLAGGDTITLGESAFLYLAPRRAGVQAEPIRVDAGDVAREAREALAGCAEAVRVARERRRRR